MSENKKLKFDLILVSLSPIFFTACIITAYIFWKIHNLTSYEFFILNIIFFVSLFTIIYNIFVCVGFTSFLKGNYDNRGEHIKIITEYENSKSIKFLNRILKITGYRIFKFSFLNPFNDILDKNKIYTAITNENVILEEKIIKRKYIANDVFLILNS